VTFCDDDSRGPAPTGRDSIAQGAALGQAKNNPRALQGRDSREQPAPASGRV